MALQNSIIAALAWVLTALVAMPVHAGTLDWVVTVAPQLSAGLVNQTCYLFLDGHAAMSMGSISGIEVSISDGDAVVEVRHSILPGDTGEFRVAVSASNPRVQRLLFGKRRVTLWAGEKPCEGLSEGGRRSLDFDDEAKRASPVGELTK